MRIITSLIIASVVGSVAIGALTRNADKMSGPDAEQILMELFARDRPAALRLLEKTASGCVPELDRLKSNNARKLFPRILLMRLETRSTKRGELTKEEATQDDGEIQNLLLALPDADKEVLVAVVDHMEKDKARIETCLSKSLREIARKEQRRQKEPLLSDVELRGS